MKKQISLLLMVFMLCSIFVVPVSANTTIDYSCYEGNWHWDAGDCELQIKSCTDTTMSFYFRYGQFAVNVTNATVDGTNVYGEYYEVWDDNVWDNYVISGNFNMSLGDSGIWVDWTFSENGSAPSTKGMMFNKPGFQLITHTISENDITVKLNDTPITFDQKPIMYDNRVMVPVRAIFEALGYEIEWNESKQQVTAKNSDNVMNMWVNDKELYHNGNLIGLDVSPMLIGDRVLVPVRIISQCAGYKVDWDDSMKTVIISQPSGIEDYANYIGVWQYFNPGATTPDVELIINEISNGIVYYDILFYRLAGYENQKASIDSEGNINFSTVMNENSSSPIAGVIHCKNNKVVLDIKSSYFDYIKPQTIELYIKSDNSILR